MLPVPPAVGPAFSFELDVEDGEVENYEVGVRTTAIFNETMLAKAIHKIVLYFASNPTFVFQISTETVKTKSEKHPFRVFLQYWVLEVLSFIFLPVAVSQNLPFQASNPQIAQLLCTTCYSSTFKS